MFRIEVLAVANFSLFTIHFSLNERFGVSLTASRRFAVSDTACCSFLTLQRYYIFIAVYEYNGRFLLSTFNCLRQIPLQRYSVTVLQSIIFSPKLLLYYI